MDTWEELDALAGTLRSENAAWAERIDALAADAETLGRLTADVDRHYTDLGVRDAFEALAQQALAGAATVYEARRPFGYSRHATLAWHAADDPRAAFASEPRDSLLTIDVAIGPRLLLDGGDDPAGAERLAVLIMGEKRLLASLPTSRERFRAALLRAFAAPRRGQDAQTAGGEQPVASTPDEAAASAQRAAEFANDLSGDRAGAEGGPSAATSGPATAESAEPAARAGTESAASAGEPAEHTGAESGGRAGEAAAETPSAASGERTPGAEAESANAASAGETPDTTEQAATAGDAKQGDDASDRHDFPKPPDVIEL